jgi:hypothetical protein
MEMDQTLEAAVIARWTAKNGENATIRTARNARRLGVRGKQAKATFFSFR